MNKKLLLGIVAFSMLTISSCETEDKDVIDDNMEEVLEENEAEDDDLDSEEEMADDMAEQDMDAEMMEEMVEEDSESLDAEVDVLGSGSFEPNNDYNYPAEGNFTIVTNDEGTVIELDENFLTQSLPDLVIYLSNESDNDDNASVISEVTVSSGAQSFVIPEDLNPDDYTYVLLFCRMYNVKVGFGIIER